MLANLIILFTREVFGEQIKNDEDLMNSKIPFGLPHESLKYFITDSDFDKYVRNNHENCEIDMGCSLRVVSTENFAVVTISRFVFANKLDFLSPTGEMAVYSFKQPLRTEYYNMYFVKGSPIFPQVNNVLLQMTSAGFVKYFDERTRFFYDLEFGKNITREKIRSKILSLDYFNLFFKIYGIGIFIALLIFCFEYVEIKIADKFNNYSRRKLF